MTNLEIDITVVQVIKRHWDKWKKRKNLFLLTPTIVVMVTQPQPGIIVAVPSLMTKLQNTRVITNYMNMYGGGEIRPDYHQTDFLPAYGTLPCIDPNPVYKNQIYIFISSHFDFNNLYTFYYQYPCVKCPGIIPIPCNFKLIGC